MNLKSIVGKRYGNWTILEVAQVAKPRNAVKARCDCGTERLINGTAVVQGNTKSCGCLRKTYFIARGARMRELRNQSAVGETFSRLVVISAIAVNGKPNYVLARCSCGIEKDVDIRSLLRGYTKSCGCLARELARTRAIKGTYATHNLSGTKLYRTWSGMMQRCYNKNAINWYNYGGRGILVCKRWHKVENFAEDMGAPPSDDLQLDRIDNEGNYELSNCRWVTREQNMANRRPRACVVCGHRPHKIIIMPLYNFGTLAYPFIT